MTIFKAASFNINSVRVRLEMLIQWLNKEQPDVLCLQETKVQDKDFPADEFRNVGYYPTFLGEKSKNGVAILSREEPMDIKFGLDEWGTAGEARLVAVKLGEIAVVNTYVPQGREVDTEYFNYKLHWLKSMRNYFERYYVKDSLLLWMGDFNVALQAEDIYDPKRLLGRVGYHPEEHSALNFVKDWGFTDIFRRHVPHEGHYTFWDYRIKNAIDRGLGWRIDHIFATERLAQASQTAWIDTTLRRMTRPSDHTPIIATFDL